MANKLQLEVSCFLWLAFAEDVLVLQLREQICLFTHSSALTIGGRRNRILCFSELIKHSGALALLTSNAQSYFIHDKFYALIVNILFVFHWCLKLI